MSTLRHRRASSLRLNLLRGASVSALLIALAPKAEASGFRTLAQALAAQSAGAAGAAGAAAASAAANGGGTAAAVAARRGTQTLNNAAARYLGVMQALAAQAHAGNPSAYNGLGATGLQPAIGAAPGGVLWTGAQLPTVAAANPNAVTVVQTQALASLTWQSFNVGAQTSLTFNQSAGGSAASSWVVINKIENPNQNPATILGSISAPGKVFILDPNGVVFGRGSQVNVGALVATTASIAAQQFSTDALGNQQLSLYGTYSTTAKTYSPTFTAAPTNAAVEVQAGATIQANGQTVGGATGTSTTPGYAMLLADYVSNAGQITTPRGQTVLASGTDFVLRPGYGATGNQLSTTQGSEIAVLNGGGVVNAATGLITAATGDITLVGHDVTQAGVLVSTTTVNLRGTVHLLTDAADPTASVTLAPGSVTEILPQDNGQTALDSQRAANISLSGSLNAERALGGGNSGYVALSDTALLADQAGSSRIEITTGVLDARNGAIAVAPGGQIAVAAAARALIETGAVLDVAGSNAAVLPMSANDLLVNVQPYQLRDSAANRTGGLNSTNVYVDARTITPITTGPYAGNAYTSGGLIEVAGYLGLVPHGIAEWTASGGSVDLQTAQAITQPGSTINVEGGSIAYSAGELNQSYVISSTGVLYNVDTAPGNLVYTGVYGGVTYNHPRWQTSQTYLNQILTPTQIYQQGYVVGRDAGVLRVSAPTAILDGTVAASVIDGPRQGLARPTGGFDPYALAQNVTPLAGALDIGQYFAGIAQDGFASAVTLGAAVPGASFVSATDTLAATLIDTVTLDAGLLSAEALGGLTISTAGDVVVSAPVTLTPGGHVSLTGAQVTVASSVTARGGAIAVSNISPLGNFLDGTLGVATGGYGIALGAGALLETRGLWTNTALDPSHGSGAAFANGGAIALDSIGALTLGVGSVLDLRGGGTQAGTKFVGAAGGNLTLVADDPALSIGVTTVGTGAVTLGGAILDDGSKGGGTLTFAAPGVQIGGALPAGLPPDFVLLPTGLFGTGFTRYALSAPQGLTVADGTAIAPVVPVDLPTLAAALLPTGSDPSAAYTLVVPPLYTPNPALDTVTQRIGASLSLTGSTTPNPINGIIGPVTIGTGARITVDPGQSIGVASYDQVTVLGTLTAPGGAISLVNNRSELTSIGLALYTPGLSVWLGGGATLDVSGIGTSFLDPFGRRFAAAATLNAGTITLGSALATSTEAQVILRPGSQLLADGAAAVTDVIPGGFSPLARPAVLAGAGGTVIARSIDGIALDGTMQADRGGPGAAGGTLVMNEVAPDYQNGPLSPTLPNFLVVPRDIVVTDAFTALQPAVLVPGGPNPAAIGTAAISQAQIASGGFDAVSLYAGDVLLFAGVNGAPVTLSAGRSISLEQRRIAVVDPATSVTIAAPYVSITGTPDNTNSYFTGVAGDAPGGQGVFTVAASQLDLRNTLAFGIDEQFKNPGPADTTPPLPPLVQDYGFASLDLTSRGDIRFLGADTGALNGNRPTSVTQGGDITLQAAQIYPATAANAVVTANATPSVFTTFASSTTGSSTTGSSTTGSSTTGSLVPSTLTILGLGGAPPQAPQSVGGTLSLVADNVIQAGVVRAPEGVIELGQTNSTYTTTNVTLDPGSVTSVSLFGQSVLYGGTADGVNYLEPGGFALEKTTPVVLLAGQAIDAQAGSIVDLRGGGTLAGAGFIAGRGGSVDVLQAPLLSTGPTVGAPSASADPVYAILPGYASPYAPVPAANGAYAPVTPGTQITVGAGIAGLPAGTYTLLPAYDALLPGAFRVQFQTGTAAPASAVAAGNFSVLAPVTTSVANAGIVAAIPVAALITGGGYVETAAGLPASAAAPGLRQLAQYNEENYSQFQIAAAAQFSAARPALPRDAKTLSFEFASTPGTLAPALAFDPGALLQAPDIGGYGATVNVYGATPLQIVGVGDAPIVGDTVIAASTLDGLAAPRLVIGGEVLIESQFGVGYEAVLNHLFSAVPFAAATSVEISSHAVLTAGDVMLTSGVLPILRTGTIAVDAGATVRSVATAARPFDTSQGYYFLTQGYSLVDVSSVAPVLSPVIASSLPEAAITIGSGANLLALGTLQFSTSAPLAFAPVVNFAARDLIVQVPSVNIATAATFAGPTGTLPSGLDLSQTLFDTLAAGGLRSLTLSASQSVNFIGAVSLDTTGVTFVLDTPAIYGFGSAAYSTTNPSTHQITTVPADVASITAGTFIWSGIATQQGFSSGIATIPASVLPGAPAAITHDSLGGTAVGLGAGALVINATTLVLGQDPALLPQDQTTLNRLALGFSTVTLNAGSEITANGRGTLAAYQSQSAYGQPGTGGALILNTPLLTTQAGALLGLTTGGAITLASPVAGNAAPGGQGGEIDLTAASILAGGTIALPAGRLTMTATANIVLDGVIQLAGETTHIFDQAVASNGGSLVMESQAGGITQLAGGSIDVSSAGAAAGGIEATALAGAVAFDGALVGGAALPAGSGNFSVRAASFTPGASASGFDALNATLDAGGFYQSRSFETGTGNVAIDHVVRARDVTVIADSGAIGVTGTVDASGFAPGTIDLAAAGDLTIATGAVLTTAGSVLQTDASGAAIDALNRGRIDLTAGAPIAGGAGTLVGQGTLTLGAGAEFDLNSPDLGATGLGQGLLDFNAPRIGAGDVAINAGSALNILGAPQIALYAWTSYQATDAVGTIVQDNGAATPVNAAGQVGIVQIGAADTVFMNAASANPALTGAGGRLAGLAAYGPLFHFRPAVEIASSAASGGNLTIASDLDFSGLRTGAGEAGSISFRAAGNLYVDGSVSDGFAPPPDSTLPTPLAADNSWQIQSDTPIPQGSGIVMTSTFQGIDHYGHPVSGGVQLGRGTEFNTGQQVALNYPIEIGATVFNANVVIPCQVKLFQAVVVPAGGLVLTAPVTIGGTRGTVTYAAGQIIPAGTVLPGRTLLGAGSVVPFKVSVDAGSVIPAGTPLSIFNMAIITLDQPVVLFAGAYLPPNTHPIFSTLQGRTLGAISLRPTMPGTTAQGYLYALAHMLPPGSQSWSMNFAAGTNLASADQRSVQAKTVLDAAIGGVFAGPTNGAAAPGSLILSDLHYLSFSGAVPQSQTFSVIRTGTGSLSMVAGGNFDEETTFGIYTAGTDVAAAAAYNQPYTVSDPSDGGQLTQAANSAYQANYATNGGDLSIMAQGDVLGASYGGEFRGSSGVLEPTSLVSNWLWRQTSQQGGQQGGQPGGQPGALPTAWWVNFGALANPSVGVPRLQLVGFDGIGTLGGGNVTVIAGGDAGATTNAVLPGLSPYRSQALNLAVGSSGQVGPTGAITQFGGGDLTLQVGGALNGEAFAATGPLTGSITDTRGNATISAGQIGGIVLDRNNYAGPDPSQHSPVQPNNGVAQNGPALVIGGGVANFYALRDVVLQGVGDPTREYVQQSADPLAQSGFSLWSPSTAVTLFSAGGNVTPSTQVADGAATAATSTLNDPVDQSANAFVYPATLLVTAASGDIIYNGGRNTPVPIETAPSAFGQVAFLAANSIFAGFIPVDLSGADPALLPTPINPSLDGNLFPVGVADTPTTNLHAADTRPALFYAGTGDIVDFQTGETVFNTQTQALDYVAAKPVWMFAGNDIVDSGTRPQTYADASFFASQPNQAAIGSNLYSSGNLFLDNNPNQISVVSAGRDILSSYFYVAGPGLLEVDAGRNLYQGGADGLQYGTIKSLGNVIGNTVSTTGGASIAVLAGTTRADGATPNYTGFENAYLNPANQANLALPLTDPANKGKVQQVYTAQLTAWLAANYPTLSLAHGALAAFDTLPLPQREVFLRQIYYDELLAGARQYNDPTSRFYHSYARGKGAIDTLFPSLGTEPNPGDPVGYTGQITMTSGTLNGVTYINGSGQTVSPVFDAGIATLFGGGAQVTNPGGAVILGVTGGQTPGAGSGIVTYGTGDISMYARDSVLLGQSRIFTTLGGNILIWSSQGDINAGRGAKTTVAYSPPLIAYDALGDLTLLPAVPSNGAGIATLQTLPGVAAGNVDLIAPLGTVDAGEAGIRVSGNLNVVALAFANSQNVATGGKTSSSTQVSAVSLGAVAAASAAAGSSQNAADDTRKRRRENTQQPSVIDLEILSVGDKRGV